MNLSVAEPAFGQSIASSSSSGDGNASAEINSAPTFNVRAYVIDGNSPLSTNAVIGMLSKHTGTNIALTNIVQAAMDLQAAYSELGYPGMSVSVALSQITDEVVKMHVYKGAFPQILVSGKPYLIPENRAATAAPAAVTVAATNAGPHFSVQTYSVEANTLLPTDVYGDVLGKYTGTNVTFSDISQAVKELQMEYHKRGYDTVTVTVPQQRLTNATFRIRVFTGRLAEIIVSGNRFFSSNNIIRSLPSLKTNIILNSKLFQSELDRANANQDRQVYPEIRPGPVSNTTSLFLTVKDRLPLHAKLEANNQSSPGTPENRLNFSGVYNNLWQLDHSLGAQYSFSEENYKAGNQWSPYDRPLVANYSTFYRLPLAAPESVADTMASRPGSFGYNEATRKFELPSASGAPELNIYASRSTIDSGVQSGALERLASSISGTIDQQTVHQDLTVNQGAGFRITEPLPEFGTFRSRIQAGLDYKTYKISSFDTNDFIFTQFLLDTSGNPFTRVSTTPSAVPPSIKSVSYMPLALRWDANWEDPYGRMDFGFNYSPDLWHSGQRTNLQSIAGSARASGYWRVFTASLAREQAIYGAWKLALRADGQWTSEPLISNEQFGVGGVGGVRGYREGEVFGDTGWRITSEVKTPAHRVGYVGGGTAQPLTVRGSFFMDYAETYLLDPAGRSGRTPLWGAGFGGVASVGYNWEGRLMFGWPLLRTQSSEPGQLRIIFNLSAQF